MKRNLLILAALAVLGGCIGGGESPKSDYYMLASVAGPVSADVDFTVKIMRPVIPGYLDRPELVEQEGDNKIRIDEYSRWAEPLDTMFERVLVQDLRQRLPSAHLLTEDDQFLSAAPRVTVAVAIQQFNRIPDGKVQLQAQYEVVDKGTHEQPPLQQMEETLNADSGGSTGNLSALVGNLADNIAEMLHSQAIRGARVAPRLPGSHLDE
jgi:uncharacterized lipoprotein YmbA